MKVSITRAELLARHREVALNRPSCQENDCFAKQLAAASGEDLDQLRAHSLTKSMQARRFQYAAAGLMATSAAAGLWGAVAALADASAIALPLSVVGFALGMTAYRELDEAALEQDRFRAQLNAWEAILSGD